jgi:hypothetical protein
MRRPITSVVFALISLVLSPILLMIELSALLFAGMVIAEPVNEPWVKVLSGALVIVVGLLALALPIIAIAMGAKARAAARSTPTTGAGLAVAAMVIGGLVTAVVLAAQVYLVLMVTGGCSLDGC